VPALQEPVTRAREKRVPGPEDPGRAVAAGTELYHRAITAANNNHPGEAARLLARALRRLDRTAETTDDWLAIRGRVLISLASAEAESGSTAEGLAHLASAEDAVRRLPEGSTRRTLRALIGLQRAVVQFRTGRLAEALALFDAIIPELERDIDDDGLLLTRTVMNRAHLLVIMNEPEAALADLRRGLRLATGHGLTRLEGKIRHTLGEQSHLVGEIPDALRHYEQAAGIYASAAPGWLARLRLDQSKALLTAGLAEDAARHLDEALPALYQTRAVQDIAEAEVARAAAAILDGDFPMAQRLAATARRRFLRRGNAPWAELAALTKLRADALDALASGSPNAGAHLPATLVRLAGRLAELGLRDEAAVARLLAVRLRLHRGAVAEAAELLAQVPKPGRTTPVDHRMLLRLCRAELALAAGKHRSALAQARAGLHELGRVRDRMGGLDLLCGTAVHGEELGQLAVGTVLGRARGQSDARRLFTWQERTRAQVYRYEPLPAIDDPVLAKYLTEMRRVQRTVQQNRLAGKPVAQLEHRYAWLQREASRLGWHASPWGRPRPVSSPEELTARLGDRVLVSLAGHRDSLAAVVVRDGRFHLVRLGALAEVVETARQLHADLDALAPDHLPAPLAEAVAGSARRRAARLDELLIRPLAASLGDRELVIVPIGPLYALPWAALPSLRGRPVSVTPSATSWVSTSTPHADPGPAGPVVLVGGPGVPGAIGEVRQLRSVYPAARLVDGQKATSTEVLAALDGASLAHLVAHGAHEPGNALFSRLDLVDGPLFAHETTRLSKPPERVVLAACELAMSHIRPGEEALGFAGTLLASGSRSVVGAVARVGDQAAAEAMSDLHLQLASGVAPAVALAEATAVDPLRRPFLCLGSG
jgi:tetratricopeptide (TPR) repeat protein